MKDSVLISEELLNSPQSRNLARLIFDLRLVSHIPVLFYANGSILGSETPHNIVLPTEIEQPLICDPKIVNWLSENSRSSPCIVEEDASVFYVVCRYEGDALCILGPCSQRPLSKLQLNSFMRKHHMHNFQNYRMHSASYQEVLALAEIIDYLIIGSLTAENSFSESNMENIKEQTPDPFPDYSSYLRQNYRLNSKQHLPYMYEQKMYEYIQNGDLEGFINFTQTQMPTSNLTFDEVSQNEIKKEEYSIASMITLFSRAAINGGVNPYDAYDISDMLLQKLSEKQTKDNFDKVSHECIRLFFDAVKRARNIAGSSAHIEKCKYYISKNLRKPFTISDIAEYVGLSANYLGNLFRKYETCTLKQYIIRERLNAAKNMLKYSDYTISAISHAFCFQSQSHFGALFKKETGMTPAEFRKINKPQNF